MSRSCDCGDICGGQTDNETRLLPYDNNHSEFETYGGGNIILCRECYKVELSFRFNRIMEGVEQVMPTWESLKVYEYNINDGKE